MAEDGSFLLFLSISEAFVAALARNMQAAQDRR
jgi:hypothetical protein